MLVEHALDVAARMLADDVPQEIHDALEHVQVRVVAWPLPGMRSDAQAVFVGRQQQGDPDDEEDDDVRATGEIILIASNLSSDEAVEQALLHEIGHALGLDELGVAELGL